MVQQFLEQHDRWVIDGNYSWLCYQERLEQADHIVFLDFPRLRCLWRAWRRSIRYRGRVRESAAEGCQEKFDWEFMRWILWEGRARAIRDRHRHIRQAYRDKVTVCKNDRDTARFLSSLTQ